ncbi:MAG: P1 family peptidase [Candidatus Aminicenantes bacterium]|nr:P1 family peptidase [Candidatus Aminicenantes bacterium]
MNKTPLVPLIILLGSSFFLVTNVLASSKNQDRPRIREFGLQIGVLSPGPLNAITDVPGVKVGQVTLIEGDNIRTGVTAILPHEGNIFQEKVPAGVAIGNAFGKLMGSTQIEELGTLETPIVLTNTLSVPVAAEAIIDYILNLPGNENVFSVNPVVGETNDGFLNDIRRRFITKEHVFEAIRRATSGPVEEGCVGAGTGTICFGFKGGIGTASRRLPPSRGGYTVGVLVQTNFGGVLQIKGIPVGPWLRTPGEEMTSFFDEQGSCMIIVATDAPLDSRNLKRLAKRALLGIARTGGYFSNGSGDYALAFSAAPEVRVKARTKENLQTQPVLRNEAMSPLFLAAAEACEEAILNSLFKASSMTGFKGRKAEALPLDKLKELMVKILEEMKEKTEK